MGERVAGIKPSWRPTTTSPEFTGRWVKIADPGVRRRAEFCYQQLDGLQTLRQAARRELLAEGRKHGATKMLRQIPGLGPIRATLLIALMQTPHRFRP